jgi:hypothetical protein
MDVNLNAQSLHLLRTLDSSMHEAEQEAAHSVEGVRGVYEVRRLPHSSQLCGTLLVP